MNDYCYLDFSLKLKKEPREELSQIFIKGAIIKSLVAIFGEIGGQTDFELLTFDEARRKGILRVAVDFAIKLRIALALIAEFQGIPSIFQVHNSSNQLNSLIDTFIEF
jgi:ribonuclease P protein subunit RPP14